MRTVYILVEGPTEEEFVNNLIAHHLSSFGIVNTIPIPLETSPGFFGGDITFDRFRRNAINLLLSDAQGIVTSLIDFYEIRSDFPGYAAAMAMTNKIESVNHIEQEIAKELNDERLFPYIQLHEFEGLLFSDIRGFQTYFPKTVPHAQYVINHYPNPELINDGPDSCPAARLKQIFNKIPRRYNKPFHGPLIALENELNTVINKCPRFRRWLDIIINKATTI